MIPKDITVKSYHELTTEAREQFFAYLKLLPQQDSSPAVQNLWHDNWTEKINTLPHALTHTDRYSARGDYFIMYDGNHRIIAHSGVHVSAFHPRVALAGSRSYVVPDHRNQLLIYNILLPKQKLWCQTHDIDVMALTFNEHNKSLIKVFTHKRFGISKHALIDKKPQDIFHTGLHVVPFPVIVKQTRQWVIYERFSSWDYDWTLIAAPQDSVPCK
jgi:hypothetical protein